MDDYYSYRNLLTYSTSICCKDSTQSVLSNNTLTEICQVTTKQKQLSFPLLSFIITKTIFRATKSIFRRTAAVFRATKSYLQAPAVAFLVLAGHLRGLSTTFLGHAGHLRSLSTTFLGQFSPLRGLKKVFLELKNPLRSLSVPFLGQFSPLRGLFSEKYSLIYFISLLKPAVIARIFTETILFLGEFVLSKRIACQN